MSSTSKHGPALRTSGSSATDGAKLFIVTLWLSASGALAARGVERGRQCAVGRMVGSLRRSIQSATCSAGSSRTRCVNRLKNLLSTSTSRSD